MHLAPLDVGALVLPPRGFQPRGLDELVGSASLARQFGDPVQKLLPKAAQVEVQRGGGLSQEYVDPKCRPRFGELLRALFEHGAIKFRKRPSPLWSPCYLEKNRDQRLMIDARIPNTAFEGARPCRARQETIFRAGERGQTSGVLRHTAA